ncbi:MAG: hypothetical protein ABIQ86_14080 [Steroidobacteraceae bacterium]
MEESTNMKMGAPRLRIQPEVEPDDEKEIPLDAPGDDTEDPEDIEGNNDVRDPVPEDTPA